MGIFSVKDEEEENKNQDLLVNIEGIIVVKL